MEIYVDYQLANGVRARSSLDKKPDTCPVCGKGVDAILHIGFADPGYGELLQVILQCPRNECRSLMIAYYRRLDPLTRGGPDYRLFDVQPNNPTRRDFSEEIEKISPAFVNIYNQAYAAEQLQLDEISGVGYRKALEFLIKDYACLEHPDNKGEIQSMFLVKCIKDYIHDSRIRDCAERAAWLGNDETHYVRQWPDKDIRDLKILIDLTVHWVSSVVLTREYTANMPKT